jgi:pilus assembly protein CpaC
MIALSLLAFCAVMPIVVAHADKADLTPVGAKSTSPTHLISVTQGKGEIVDIKGDIADVLVANPSIADVVAIQSNKLYVVGSKLGDTNLMVLDANGNELQRFDIHVKIDETALQAYLNATFPDEHVKVKALNGRLMLSGDVSTPDAASRISEVVGGYITQVEGVKDTTDKVIVNLLHVQGEQQVMLKVRILEADKNLLKELGIETALTNGGLGGNLTAGNTVTTKTGLTADPFGIGTLVFNDGTTGPAQILINALERDNLIHTLAEPNLTAISGQEAGFLAGGEFPVPTGRDQYGNITIQFRAFGVSLNFKPTVLSESRISLQLKTEVSSLSRDNAVTLAQLTVPGLNIRRASTTVEVPSGGGLMIAGLLEAQTVQGMSGLPGIMNTPVLGDLIKSRSFNRQESELVVLITAYMVKPFGDKTAARPITTPEPLAQPPAKVPPFKTGSIDIPASKPFDPPYDSNSPLRTSFAGNIRRIYGHKAPVTLDQPGRYGYIME